MYKCLECGNIFDPCEAKTVTEYYDEVDGGAYEYFAVCPICGGDFEETVACAECGGEFLEDELIGDYCQDCLNELLTLDSFLEFATTGVKSPSEPDVLEDFVLRELFDITGDEILVSSSTAFKDACKEAYQTAVDEDQCVWRPGNGSLLKTIQNYITDCGLWYEFAEYLETKGGAEK